MWSTVVGQRFCRRTQRKINIGLTQNTNSTCLVASLHHRVRNGDAVLDAWVVGKGKEAEHQGYAAYERDPALRVPSVVGRSFFQASCVSLPSLVSLFP